ncbi:MAG: hypothetical protein AABZ84_10105 [Pseudomonadota bacterium]
MIALLLAGCSGGKGAPASGGGGAGGGNDNSGGDAAPEPTYLFFGGGLTAVDPSNPATPISLETGSVTGARTALAGRQDTPTRVSGLYVRSVIYGRGGKLWQVNALTAATPSPLQVSNETAANVVCSTYVSDDLADHAHTAYVYELGGVDNQCATAGDNLWKMIRLNMSETATPFTAVKPVIDLGSDVTGAVTGWLGVSGGALYKYDADFASPLLLTPYNSQVLFLVAITNQRVIIRVDNDLYMYDDALGALSSSLHHFSSAAAGAFQSDGTSLYFADGGSIYKLALSGGAAAGLVVAENNVSSAGLTLALTDAYLIYSWRDATTAVNTLNRLAKTGGSAQPIFSGIEGVRVMTAADLIYYTIGSTTSLTSYVLRENGVTLAQYDAALWWGQSLPSTVDAAEMTRPNKIFLMEGYTNTSSFFANGTISAYDAATHVRSAVLGTIPANITDILFSGIGDAVMGLGTTTANPPGTDIFIANANVDGSLVRVTTTGGVNEQPL